MMMRRMTREAKNMAAGERWREKKYCTKLGKIRLYFERERIMRER